MSAPTDEELAEMSTAWGVSIERLRFLATCPHYDSKPHIRVDDFKEPADRHIAKAIREAIRGSWTPADAAKIANLPLGTIEAFICRHGIIWPPGCRRRLEWGRGTTHTHRLNDEHANLLAKGKLTMAQAAAKGVAEGLTAKETADRFGFSAPGMYNAAVRQGLKFISHVEKFGRPRGVAVDPLMAEARASVELSLKNRPKA
jgi:hypothetical protein